MIMNDDQMKRYVNSLMSDVRIHGGGDRDQRAINMGTSREVDEFWGDDAPRFRLRPEQLPPFTPIAWKMWLILNDRGWGKTTALVRWAIYQAVNIDQPMTRGAIVCPTDVHLQEFSHELLRCSQPGFVPVYFPTRRLLKFPSGTEVLLIPANFPDRLRGVQFHWAVGDDIHLWAHPLEIYEHLMHGLRLGQSPRLVLAGERIRQKMLTRLLSHRTVITSSVIVE